jgi:hypothetical protein
MEEIYSDHRRGEPLHLFRGHSNQISRIGPLELNKSPVFTRIQVNRYAFLWSES